MNNDYSGLMNVVRHNTEYTSEPFSADQKHGDFHAVRDIALRRGRYEISVGLANKNLCTASLSSRKVL